MKIQEEEKTCKNCKYFLQHYVKNGIKYVPTYFGHCINGDLPKKEQRDRNYKKIYKACVLWESEEIQKEERRQTIKNALSLMAEKIEQISMILKDDGE